MQRRNLLIVTITVIFTAVFTAGWYLGHSNSTIISEVRAAGGVVTSPTTPVPDRYVYYPGPEGGRQAGPMRFGFGGQVA
jgi:hypothetical protein